MPEDGVLLEETVYDSPPAEPPPVQPTSDSPDPSSQAPGTGDTSGADGAEPEAEEEPLPEFDEKYRSDFEGLLYLGALRDEFVWLGHRFVIRTLNTNEFIEVGLAVKDSIGTDAYAKSYQSAIVAACVVSVDGKGMPVPITNDPADTPFHNAWRYIKDNWFPPTIDAIYERYLALEIKTRAVVESMGKVSG